MIGSMRLASSHSLHGVVRKWWRTFSGSTASWAVAQWLWGWREFVSGACLFTFYASKALCGKVPFFLPSACVEADQPQHGQILEYTSLREEKGTSRKIQWELVLSSESQKKKKKTMLIYKKWVSGFPSMPLCHNNVAFPHDLCSGGWWLIFFQLGHFQGSKIKLWNVFGTGHDHCMLRAFGSVVHHPEIHTVNLTMLGSIGKENQIGREDANPDAKTMKHINSNSFSGKYGTRGPAFGRGVHQTGHYLLLVRPHKQVQKNKKHWCQTSSRSGTILAPLGMQKLMIGQDFPIANPLPWKSIEGPEGIPCRV